MIGKHLINHDGSVSGTVDKIAVSPDDRLMVRISDAWFFFDETREGAAFLG
ncbi:hypothetical protein [Pararhizobium mangrovi]|uniref:hypothetical protein n=1 Tax=Pararhizobium mangrovi TaxID=2590452 RepID=UPI0015E848E0|nr:hypothetical protein [Pararhizobium mangrovi]